MDFGIILQENTDVKTKQEKKLDEFAMKGTLAHKIRP
jgi:propanediol dehydratase small subunit